jgi:hypothetical protein
MSVAILAIVEGQSEEASVPELLRRILHERLGSFNVQVAKPFRVKRNRIVKPGELERAIKQGVRTRADIAAVLVILDADDDCPAELAPQLLRRVAGETHLPASVVLAKREFEAWFLGCLESFRGFQSIPQDAVSPDHPETDDAKGALKKLTGQDRYNTAVDQVRFVQEMNFDLCRERCPSFDKLLRDIECLASAMTRS